MLQNALRRQLRVGVQRNRVMSNVMAMRGMKDHSEHPERPDKIKETMTTSQKLHRTKTPDPNAEARAGGGKESVLKKQHSGIHTKSGGFKFGRDSGPSIIAFLVLLIGAPISIGYLTGHRGTWNGNLEQNAILTRQKQVKEEFGKGGGGWGDGPGGTGFGQRGAEMGMADKSKPRDLAEGQPEVYKG